MVAMHCKLLLKPPDATEQRSERRFLCLKLLLEGGKLDSDACIRTLSCLGRRQSRTMRGCDRQAPSYGRQQRFLSGCVDTDDAWQNEGSERRHGRAAGCRASI